MTSSVACDIRAFYVQFFFNHTQLMTGPDCAVVLGVLLVWIPDIAYGALLYLLFCESFVVVK